MGLNPIDFSRSMVALVAAAPMASFLRKLSSLLKLFATRYLSILQLSVIIFAAGLMYWTENTLAEPQPVLQCAAALALEGVAAHGTGGGLGKQGLSAWRQNMRS